MNGHECFCLITSSTNALKLTALKASSDLFDARRSAADSSMNFFELRRAGRGLSSASGEFFRECLFDARRPDRLSESSCFFSIVSSSELSDSSLSSCARFDDRREAGFSTFLTFTGCSSSLSDLSLSSSSSAIIAKVSKTDINWSCFGNLKEFWQFYYRRTNSIKWEESTLISFINVNEWKMSLRKLMFWTFVHSASLDALWSLLNAGAFPALPVLEIRSLNRRLGTFRVTLHVTIAALAQDAFVVANHADFGFGIGLGDAAG